MTAPMPLCPGGYYHMADESGNKASAGIIALGRLVRKHQQCEDMALWLAVLHTLEWCEKIHGRLTVCPRACDQCDAARKMTTMVEAGWTA